MSSITCITVSTLIIVSVANLILLTMVLMNPKNNCEDLEYELINGKLKTNPENNKLKDLMYSKSLKYGRREPKYMAALVVLKYKKLLIMCGTTIISRFWILTTAHCCHSVQNYPLENLKVSSNSMQWKVGVPRDVEEIYIHKNYTPSTVTHNVCLIKVVQSFKDEFEKPIPIANSKFKYVADSEATATGWNSEINDNDLVDDDMYSVKVKLVPYEICRRKYKFKQIDPTMVCAENLDDAASCNYDSGGPLFQKNRVIGVISFQTDCASGIYPRVFTRISYFENWIKFVEQIKGISIGATFIS